MKIVLIIFCVLLFIGMIGLDIFISSNVDKKDQKEETHDDEK